MKIITVNSKTHGAKEILVDDEDYKMLSAYSWCVIRGRDKNAFYASTQGMRDGKRIGMTMHRLLMNFPAGQIDHKNNNGLDNQKSNLRVCNQLQNNMNKPIYRNNRCGYKGVYFHKFSGKYYAEISMRGKKTRLGSFTDVRLAAEAYNAKALELFGEFANINKL